MKIKDCCECKFNAICSARRYFSSKETSAMVNTTQALTGNYTEAMDEVNLALAKHCGFYKQAH